MPGVVNTGVKNFRRNLPLWGGLYVAKLLLALLFAMPFLIMIEGSLANSPYARALMSSWSLDVMIELFTVRENVLSTFMVILFFYAVAVFFLKQFLNGGIYYTYLSSGRTNLFTFFGEGARQFRGNLKISLVMIVIYLIALLIGSFVSALVPGDWFGYFGSGGIRAVLARTVVVFLFLIAAFVLSDLLRLRLAAFPNELLSVSFRAVIAFCRENFVKCYGIYLLYFAPLVVICFLFERLSIATTAAIAGMIGVIIELALFQISAFLHVGQSLIFTASLAPLLKRSQPGRFKEVIQGELQLD